MSSHAKPPPAQTRAAAVTLIGTLCGVTPVGATLDNKLDDIITKTGYATALAAMANDPVKWKILGLAAVLSVGGEIGPFSD